MLARVRHRLTYANVMSTLAVFLVLATGTAYAGHLVVRSSDVVDNSLEGRDINESTLGRVPSATIGGFGSDEQNFGDDNCNPESTRYLACAIVTVTLPRPARVLLIGSVQAASQSAGQGFGACRLGTTAGKVPNTRVVVGTANTTEGPEHLSIAGVTDVFPAGQHSFGIDCNESIYGGIQYRDNAITAVAISPKT